MKKSYIYFALLFAAVFLVASCNKEDDLSRNATQKEEVALTGNEAKSIESLCEEYFKANANENASAEKIISVTKEFMLISKNTKEFTNKKPCRIQPIYSYGVDGVAYYEVWFTEDSKTVQGWILISATDKDYPLVNFSQGIPYSSRMINESTKNNKVYRFGASYYVMEKDGQKVAEYGKMPTYITNTEVENGDGGQADTKDPKSMLRKSSVEAKEGVDYILIADYAALKEIFPRYYFSKKRGSISREMGTRLFPKNGHGEAAKSSARLAGEYQYRWAGGQQCYYTQIPAYTGWNYTACWSGCVNNAWTNIFGWWDRNRAKGALIPTTYYGEASPIYRNTSDRQNVIDPVQMYCRSVVGTYCGDGTGWTSNSNIWKGSQYPGTKGYGYTYQYQWCNSGGCNVNLANIVTDAIANNYTPAHIAANSHAYVGYGWAQWTDNTDWTWAYCYPGWSENNNDDVWISWHDFTGAVKLIVY